MLAGKIHDYFAKDDIWLSKTALTWGSIKPDIIETGISHFKDETIENFYKEYEELKEINPDQNPYKFAVKLGELFHYITDYFSRAHTDPELEAGTFFEKAKHIFYEWKLNRIAQNLHPDFFKEDIETRPVHKKSIADFIEDEHKKFIEYEYTFKNDIAAAFKICVLMTNKIVFEMQAQHSYAFSYEFNLRHRLLYQNA
ncbi:zinc dependent phospholipase C family protein [Halanaerobium sp. Z-7514]|uniref:Zinc dependent phospholipase C family protein n=1 Tax=Halanaerobium polyolivorans TaxID=2886943 RepID=A0AAW4WUH7_9FIRM|nr:zinc dependent phospholipase C family protein [Halanaerobium polyolivorans]